jgi:hypothetical protein
MPTLRAIPSAILLLALNAVLSLATGAEDGEAAVLRMYDLTDLVETPADFPPRSLSVATADATDLIARAAAPAPAHVLDLDTFLANRFEPGIAARLRRACELRNGTTLFLTETPAMHRHVEGVLARARAQAGLQVTITARLFLMDPVLRQSRYGFAGLPWREVPDARGLMWADLAAPDCAIIGQTLAKDHEVELVSAPSLTTFAGQLANASFIRQLAYAKLGFSPAGQVLVSDTVALGETLAVRATATGDRAFIHLVFDHRACRLLELRRTPIDGARVAEQPILWEGGERLDAALAAGHGAIIATGLYSDRDGDGKPVERTGFMLIRAEIVEPADPPRAQPTAAPETPRVEHAPIGPQGAKPAPAAQPKGANEF